MAKEREQRQRPGEPTCNNCGKTHAKTVHVCVLAALLALVVDRGDKGKRFARRAVARVDVDAFWDDVGPIIDKLEDGWYDIAVAWR